MSTTASKAEAVSKLTELDRQLRDRLQKRELDELVSATADMVHGSTDTSPSAYSGEERPSPATLAAARRANLMRGFRLRRQVLEDTLTAAEVVQLLGAVSRQTPHDRVNAGTLVAVKDGGRLRFPLWQFDPDGPDGVVEGLPEVVRALPRQSQIGRLRWLSTPKPGLSGRSPVEALRQGDVASVLGEASAVRAT